MKSNLRTAPLAAVMILLLATAILPVLAEPTIEILPAATATNPNMSTPQLIDAALARGEIDQDTANLYLAYALGDYEMLPAEYHSTVPWDGTLPMLRLREAIPAMRSATARDTVSRILAGTCGSSTTSMSNTHNSTHFHIEYNSIAGGLNITSYAASLETAWATEVISFSWAAPPVLASNPPPGNRYHVRIDALGSGLYGYVTTTGVHAGFVGNNPATAWNDLDAYATCMVLNNDYSGFPGTAQAALDATTAHEFNHSIQIGYGSLTGSNAPDDALVEGGATWMEDEVFDGANDNYNYLWPEFDECMGEYTPSPYPYWITLRGLTERYGTGTAGAGEDVMQDFWETISGSTTGMLTALNSALVNQGDSLADNYHEYAIAVKFNRPCGGSYAYPYCFEEGAAYVSAAGNTSVHGTIASAPGIYSGSIEDNYALNWVDLPATGGVYSVTLSNTSAGGQLHASLVCDTGSALNVTAFPTLVSSGGSSTVASYNTSGCNDVIAVITNQSQTSANPSSCTARSYTLTAGDFDLDNFGYLPLVVSNAGDPLGPTPGFWQAPTSEQFYVTLDRSYVDNFAVLVNVTGCGYYWITHLPAEPITSNSFSFTGDFYASGTFNTATAASGTDGLASLYIAGCGYVSGGPWDWSAIWVNSSQPRIVRAEVVAPASAVPAEANDGSYRIARIK